MNTTPIGPETDSSFGRAKMPKRFLPRKRKLFFPMQSLRPVAERYNLLQVESQLDRLGGENMRRKSGRTHHAEIFGCDTAAQYLFIEY